MDKYVFTLTLWVSHPDADLSAVPAKLGLAYKYLWNKGAPRKTRKGRALPGFYEHSRCAFELDVSQETSLPTGLRTAIGILNTHRTYLAELSGGGVKISLFAGIYADEQNARDILGWEILRDLAELRISLDFDFYGLDQAESESQDSN